MFRWASPQPIPQRLEELLQRAGAERRLWQERQASDALIVLAPHWLLACGRLPLEGLQTSYRMLQEASEGQAVLLNGERLLNFSAAELAAWTIEQPLPRPAPLTGLPALEAAVTIALIQQDPQLALAYEQLDQRSERGGAAAEQAYGQRLAALDAGALVEHWNQQLRRDQADIDLELVRLQLRDVEEECERQFLSAREEASRLRREQRRAAQLGGQLQRANGLMETLISLQGRLL